MIKTRRSKRKVPDTGIFQLLQYRRRPFIIHKNAYSLGILRQICSFFRKPGFDEAKRVIGAILFQVLPVKLVRAIYGYMHALKL
jgi:hypothetical protein